MKMLNRYFYSLKKAYQPKISEIKAIPANPKFSTKAGLKACGKSKRKGKTKITKGKANTSYILYPKPNMCIHNNKYNYRYAASAKAPPQRLGLRGSGRQSQKHPALFRRLLR